MEQSFELAFRGSSKIVPLRKGKFRVSDEHGQDVHGEVRLWKSMSGLDLF